MLGQKYYKMLPDTMRFCSDDSSAYIELKHELEKSATIQWNTPGTVISSIKKLKVSKESGRYRLKVISPQGVFRDSTYVKLYTKPKLYLRDTLVCKGQALVLDARNPGMKYTWNTRETTQKIRVESSGRYWVKINNSGCSVVDTVRVKFLQNALNASSSEVTFCLNEENKTLSVKGNAGGRILWSTGATSPSITATREGVYWVRTENRECGIQTDSVRVKLKACECEMLIPNSFTPNEDNRNDYFFPVVQCEYVNYSLTISDRWGNTVFTTNNVNAKWDGRFKGNLCPEDIYVYHIETTEKITDKKLIRNGHISLFR
ncbi:MAG TPA: gliding motility-associated C-terminal domain-containing protein [Bacteroidia bacterium]|nr:gliding motility-associated C-terminal domain-containing protein [Bacteroidia bacterium]